MALPKYDELMPQAVYILHQLGPTAWRKLEQPLAESFGLSEEEVAIEYSSGNGTVFLDRIGWALSYLSMSKLVERPRRGVYQITALGRQYLGKPDELKVFVKHKISEREAAKRATKAALGAVEPLEPATEASSLTPHEALNNAAASIRTNTYYAIIDTILSKSSYEFEKLVVKLLDKMGYGGQVKEAGTVTKAANDGGIDGIIKEDVLGFGRIHIQAKRYGRSSTVGREEVQKFVGALAVAQSNKGVLITTSSFSKGATQYVDSLNGSTNVVLIDGDQLAEYIYDYGLGMQTEDTIVIKKMDSDFWDAMADAKSE
ncbi:restriction endonuclease [Ferrimonas balearica]|uniref:restriction endonuclease n=1 Tax=Ferrimonas balearica TaxID=44012 RepID=UPI001C567B5A|nr:restriction endonuclease [Ferrimonas balearica]MBW3164589.1 restriction endonuclease [Ferrimonas balearica]